MNVSDVNSSACDVNSSACDVNSSACDVNSSILLQGLDMFDLLKAFSLRVLSSSSSFHGHMGLVVRKPVFGVSDQVRHKPGYTATEDG